MTKFRVGALVAAGVLAGGLATSASAADLGGNCCADLEERIAELEATTARKGNRKVSLTVSGWVGQQVMWWDDGRESNTYVTDLGSTIASHVKFTGQATILPGWYAGYVLHLEATGSDSLTTSQNVVDGPNAILVPHTVNGVSTLQSFWFIKSDQLGKVSIGKESDAADNAAILVDGSGSLVPANWVAFDVNSFFIREKGTGNLSPAVWGGNYCQSWGGAWGDCAGIPRNSVRYDSPTFGGFSVSASWGEDDLWAVTTRYAGEWHDFKVAAVASYTQSNDENCCNTASGFVITNNTQQYFQAAGYIEHVPTGLWMYGAYGHDDYDDPTNLTDSRGQSETWYLKGGIRQRWNPLGHTVLYGEYEHVHGEGVFAESGVDGFAANGDFSAANRDTTKIWGLGVVQEIDAAAMSVWLKYRHLEYDDNSGIQFDDFQYFSFGGLINY
ncbi:porin [Hyphomicrobium sp.]|uniref:porin n=1 Tax=Hyphomicrobium sp. TaxID=82 RepID=UPI000FBDAE44|nr:porin [Hyphomicrobium sp.]RUP10487.1 MAG: porin [Hyphomicrobium sp.]